MATILKQFRFVVVHCAQHVEDPLPVLHGQLVHAAGYNPCLDSLGTIWVRQIQRLRIPAKEIIHRYGKGSQYTTQLLQTATFLKAHGKQSKSFVLHLPMLINKQKALEVLTMKGMPPMFRSLYANMAEIPFETGKDVKIYVNDQTPGEDWDYLSTTDESFRDGEVGKWIRARFPNPSRFEKIREIYTEDGDEICT